MPCQVEYVSGTQTVVVIGSGRVTSQDALQANEEASRLLIENRATRVLAEYSDAVVELPTMDIHSLPGHSETLGIPKNIRIALVVPSTRHKVEDFRFYEDVCQNRGYNCRMFSSREAAVKWLEEDQLDAS